jgi:hypothetical protein
VREKEESFKGVSAARLHFLRQRKKPCPDKDKVQIRQARRPDASASGLARLGGQAQDEEVTSDREKARGTKPNSRRQKTTRATADSCLRQAGLTRPECGRFGTPEAERSRVGLKNHRYKASRLVQWRRRSRLAPTNPKSRRTSRKAKAADLQKHQVCATRATADPSHHPDSMHRAGSG